LRLKRMQAIAIETKTVEEVNGTCINCSRKGTIAKTEIPINTDNGMQNAGLR
jgi:hypothetical protein